MDEVAKNKQLISENKKLQKNVSDLQKEMDQIFSNLREGFVITRRKIEK